MIPILAEVGGRIRFDEIVEGETLRKERDPGGAERWVIMEHKGDLHPQIVIEDDRGQSLAFYYVPEKAHLEVREGNTVSAGSVLAKTPREVGGTQDITGGLPRVTEIFEARRPKEPAVIAERAGKGELISEKTRGKRKILVHPVHYKGRATHKPSSEHLVPHGKHLRVHGGDFVQEGDALVDGPLVPHDILRISGAEAVQQYLLREVQNVYRTQRVEIDDKHIEIIIAQMLRKVRVDKVADTTLLPGIVIDKFELRKINQALLECCKIVTPGDTEFHLDDIVPQATLDDVNAQVEAADGKPAKHTRPKPASASPQLLGITKAAVQSDSFISAATFQETTNAPAAPFVFNPAPGGLVRRGGLLFPSFRSFDPPQPAPPPPTRAVPCPKRTPFPFGARPAMTAVGVDVEIGRDFRFEEHVVKL